MAEQSAPASGSGPPETPSILTKAFDLLGAFNPHERVMTLSELARASGLPKSTVHRLLARLVELGAVEHHRSAYKIGLGLMRLGASTPAGYMRDLAMPHLAKLHGWSGHTVHFGVLREYDVVYLEKVATRDTRSTIATVGTRLPANCTAIGKILLAHENLEDLENFLPPRMPQMTPHSITEVPALVQQLRQAHDEGIAREFEEAQIGMTCAAAAVCMNGFAVGAVSLSYPAEAQPPPQLESALRTTAAKVVEELEIGLAQGREHWFPREF